MVALVWFREDLRLTDHSALQAAVETDLPIISVYIYEDHLVEKLGGASKWWLHHSLLSLQESFKKLDGGLVFKKGSAKTVITDLIKKHSITHVFWHRRYDEHGRKEDQVLKSLLKKQGIICQSFPGYLLSEPHEVTNKTGDSFKVFRAFQSRIPTFEKDYQPLSAPKVIHFFKDSNSFSDKLESYNLLPHHPDWAGGLKQRWQPGEQTAQEYFQSFLEHDLKGYKVDRDYPFLDATSHLSPHLRWGEISIRQIWHTIQNHLVSNHLNYAATEKFLTELKWRDFCYYVLYHYSDLAHKSQKQEWDSFPWEDDNTFLKTWQKGLTGYPIIDAGMRELYATGYLPNRVRMIVASFLVKDLLQSWQKGAEWFMDTLIDGDEAINSFNWQWVSSSGYESSPYFRIFNPFLQGKKFDPEGKYVKKWVPELKNVPKKYIHAPWQMPESERFKVGLELGKDYPEPIVNHEEAAAKAIKLAKNLK